MKKEIWHSLGHTVLVGIYVSIVAYVMNHGQQWFGQGNKVWTPIAVLMLFVLSAAITGTLVIGRPILLYLEGKKKEGLQFFGYTVGWLFVLTVIAFTILVATK